MMGQIDEWFFKSLAGIRPAVVTFGQDENEAKLGYRNFIIAPKPVGDLEYVKTSYETIYGTIVSDWVHKDGQFVLNISLPVNTTALVYLPGKRVPQEVQSGTCQFKVNEKY